MENFSFFPEQASTMATQIDAIYFVLVGLSVIFAVGIAVAVIVFGIRYRKSTSVDRSNPLHESMKLEFAWSFIPFLMAMGIFTWSAFVYYNINTPPTDAVEIYVVGKQWMWQIQHPLGKAELNELHVPINQPVKLIMSSQDVIHSFFVPAFRVKQDVLPGRYTTLWFEATKVGEYHLFCAEYCGTEHSKMTGKVIAMEPQDYQNWLSGGGGGESMVEAGARLFQDNGCASCHIDGEGGRGPNLHGIFGTEVALEGGGTAVVDEAYLRESIYEPGAKVVAGYAPIMPSYQGSISEGGVLQLVAYIKSLSEGQ
ncbi:MAG: cytochrome c oxidase subunit II [Chloroflexi bacterium]|nr:MAG: cytochrome c oxidase subunit II [Chloroflexota bacterium]